MKFVEVENVGYKLYGIGDDAHQAIPTEDDNYWGQVWYNAKQMLFELAGPLGEQAWGIYTIMGPDANSTPGTTTNFFANHPEIKAQVKELIANVQNAYGGLLHLVPSTLKTTNWFIENLPWIAFVAAGIYVYSLSKK